MSPFIFRSRGTLNHALSPVINIIDVRHEEQLIIALV